MTYSLDSKLSKNQEKTARGSVVASWCYVSIRHSSVGVLVTHLPNGSKSISQAAAKCRETLRGNLLFRQK